MAYTNKDLDGNTSVANINWSDFNSLYDSIAHNIPAGYVAPSGKVPSAQEPERYRDPKREAIFVSPRVDIGLSLIMRR